METFVKNSTETDAAKVGQGISKAPEADALRAALLTVVTDAARRLERLSRVSTDPASRDESDWAKLICAFAAGHGVLEAVRPLMEADPGIGAAADRLGRVLSSV